MDKANNDNEKINKSKRSILLYMITAVILVIVIIYIGFVLFFMNHYYFNTVIGDMDCSALTQAKVKELIQQRAKEYSLTIYGREGFEGTITASEIDLEYCFNDNFDEIKKSQNAFFWIPSIWKQSIYDLPVDIEYEKVKLQKRMKEMYLFQQDKMRKPENAHISDYDETTKKYRVIAEDPGTTIDLKKAKVEIENSIENLLIELPMEETDCYLNPTIYQDDKKLEYFCSRLNKYVSTQIIYDWNGSNEIVDGDLIHTWLLIDMDKNKVHIDPEKLKEYIALMSRKHDTYGTKRNFITTGGREVVVDGGTYGWRTDRKKEMIKLAGLIRAGEHTEREPFYLYMAYAKGENDIGKSYVEIDLTNQHLYLYSEGKMVVESDFVSGNVSRGFSTPSGVYGLTYKTKDAVLRGQGYETPVSFWMPFNGNIGMHDATWRKQFGGSIYKTSGSHGCINLPKEKAEEIYQYVEKGFPVVCYEGELDKYKDDLDTDNEVSEENEVEDDEEADEAEGDR